MGVCGPQIVKVCKKRLCVDLTAHAKLRRATLLHQSGTHPWEMLALLRPEDPLAPLHGGGALLGQKNIAVCVGASKYSCILVHCFADLVKNGCVRTLK